MTLFMPAL